MAGISIPIRGNTAGLRASMRELTTVIRQLSKDIQATFRPAAQAAMKTEQATKQVAQSAQKGRRSFVQMAAGAAAVISATAGITGAVVSLAAHVPQIIRLGRAIAMSLKEPIRQAGTETMGFGAKLRKIASSPAFKVLAIGAIGAGVAIAGMVIGVRTVGNVLKRFGSVAGGIFRGIGRAAQAAGRVVKGAFSALRSLVPGGGGGGGGLFGGLAGLVGIGAAIALVTSQLKGAFSAAAAFEDLQVRVESFTGSAKAARDLLKEMEQFASVTPFETKDMQELAAILLGAGIKDNVGAIAKSIAAVSRNGQQLGELGDALAKGFAKGKFQTEELNKFLERGINLMPQLAAVTGLTGKELTKAIEAGLDFNLVVEAINRMSQAGGQFFGVLARQSKTFTGLWSTFVSLFNEARKAFAMPILESVKPILLDAIELVGTFKEKAAAAGKAIGDALLAGFALIKSGRTMALLDAGLKVAFFGGIDILMRGLRAAVAFLSTALPPVFRAATALLQDPNFWSGLRNIFRALGLTMAAEIREGMGMSDAAALARGGAETAFDIGKNQIAGAGKGEEAAAAMIDAVKRGIEAATAQLKGPMGYQLKEALGWLSIMKSSVEREIEAMKKKAAVPPPAEGATGQGTGTRSDGSEGLGGMLKQVMTLTTSLGRIGGGGFGMTLSPMVAEQKKGNETLKKIEKNTQGLANGTATYA